MNLDKERSVLITIPARAGSKRLSKKNTLKLQGKPLFYYTIKAALDSEITSEIYVLSDSKKTLGLAEQYGMKTFLLPQELAGDTTGVVRASLYLAHELKRSGKEFDDIICLQPTSPLRTGKDIFDAYELFKLKEADSLVSVCEVDPHYFHWAVEREATGFSKLYFGKMFLKPRQELPTMYFPNGAIKIATTDFLTKEGHFFSDKLVSYVMPQERSVHIATKIDFDLCSLLLKKRMKEKLIGGKIS